MPSSSAKPKKPTQEELDEERLREIEARIKELTKLMSEGTDRPAADERLGRAREERDAHKGNRKERAFHKPPGGGGKPIAVSRHTQTHLALGEALRLRIRLGEFALDLGDSLERLAEEQVEVLERQLKRARY